MSLRVDNSGYAFPAGQPNFWMSEMQARWQVPDLLYRFGLSPSPPLPTMSVLRDVLGHAATYGIAALVRRGPVERPAWGHPLHRR